MPAYEVYVNTPGGATVLTLSDPDPPAAIRTRWLQSMRQGVSPLLQFEGESALVGGEGRGSGTVLGPAVFAIIPKP